MLLAGSCDCSKTYSKICSGDYSLWSQIHIQWRCDAKDPDWMGSTVDRKSTSGYCFSLGSTMISWSSRKQGFVAQSTAEAEYTAASTAGRKAVWLRKLFSDLFKSKLEPTVIHCENQSCIKLTENPVFHD
jgi:hypothetical protein